MKSGDAIDEVAGEEGGDVGSDTYDEAAVFVNWLNTSQNFQAAYNFDAMGNFQLWDGSEAWQLDGQNLYRHKDAYYFLPSVDEWYKAAFYDAGTETYDIYATGNSAPDGIDSSGDAVFDAVYRDGFDQGRPNDITNAGVLSAYGTMGQTGNVWEYEETAFDLLNDSASEDRTRRGGSWATIDLNDLSRTERSSFPPDAETHPNLGFRVAAIPEPSRALLCLLGLCGVLVRRRR